jgi:glycosyltransferase involved in cell wall biosynthesis
MRIGVEARKTFGSGIGRVTALVCAWLASNSQRWEVLAFGPPSETRRLPESIQRVEWRATPFSSEDIHQLPALVEQYRIDLFVSMQFYTSPYVACSHIRFIHDLWPLRLPDLRPSRAELDSYFGGEHIQQALEEFGSERPAGDSPMRQLLTGIYEAGIASADAVVTVSHHVREQLYEQWPEHRDKLYVVHPVPTPGALPSRWPARRPLHRHLAAKQPYVLHVGNWEPRKNQLALLEALEQARVKLDQDIHLVMVGDHVGSYQQYAARLRQVVHEAISHGWLHHVGKPDDARLWDLYRGARVVVQPSLDEGFGLPALEAMWLGTPLIVAAAGALPEVCEDAARYADPNDVESIALLLADCWVDEDMRHRLSTAGHERTRALAATAPNPRDRFLALVEKVRQGQVRRRPPFRL